MQNASVPPFRILPIHPPPPRTAYHHLSPFVIFVLVIIKLMDHFSLARERARALMHMHTGGGGVCVCVGTHTYSFVFRLYKV